MLSVESDQFKRSLEDVIRWCSGLPLSSMDRDSPSVALRRVLLEQANRSWEEATRVAKSGWHHTEQGKDANRLFSEILESAGPIVSEFRSPQLKPSLDMTLYVPESDLMNAVNEVVTKRSRIPLPHWTARHSTFAKDGRLLLYYPSENLVDGAAQVASAGFYDVNNVPPWDIWVDFSDGALMSWVPPALVEVAQMGIDANPENCIRWHDQWECRFA